MDMLEDDDVETTVPAYEPYVIPRLVLPGGGWVTFGDPEELTAKDMRRLRRALDMPGTGSATNQMYETAMQLLVEAWHIPQRPDLPIPKYDKSGKGDITGRLTARQLRTIERHMSPTLKRIQGGDENDDQAEDETPI